MVGHDQAAHNDRGQTPLDSYDLEVGRLVRASSELEYMLATLVAIILDLDKGRVPLDLVQRYQREGLESLVKGLIEWKYPNIPSLSDDWKALKVRLERNRGERNAIVHAYAPGGQEHANTIVTLAANPMRKESISDLGFRKRTPEEVAHIGDETRELGREIEAFSIVCTQPKKGKGS